SLRSEEIQPGDVLQIVAGQRIAADGRVLEGSAHVDEQILTGESVPVVKSPGDDVRAGSVSLDGSLAVEVMAAGRDSTIGRMIELLRRARESKSQYERLADRASAAFVPLTFILAAVGATLGWHSAGP